MASNYSSYSTPNSPHPAPFYTSPYIPYGIRQAPYGHAAQELPRSQSYNDLGTSPSFHYMPPKASSILMSPVAGPQYFGPERATRRANSAASYPITSPLPVDLEAKSATASHQGAPPTLSRYRGRHHRAHSAASVPESSSALMPLGLHKTNYNNSISSSDASGDSESLITQTSVSSTSSEPCGLDEDAKTSLAKISHQVPSNLSLKHPRESIDHGDHTEAESRKSTPQLNAKLDSNRAPYGRGQITERDARTTTSPSKTESLLQKTEPRGGLVASNSGPSWTAKGAHLERFKPAGLTLPSDSRPRSQSVSSLRTVWNPRQSLVGEFEKGSARISDDADVRASTPPPFSHNQSGSRPSELHRPHRPPQIATPSAPQPAKQAPTYGRKPSLSPSSPKSVTSMNLPATSDRAHDWSSIGKASRHNRSMSAVSAGNPSIKKSRSFGSKLRDFLGIAGKSSGSKEPVADSLDDSDTRSIASTRTNFSYVSSTSIISLGSKLRRKAKSSSTAESQVASTFYANADAPRSPSVQHATEVPHALPPMAKVEASHEQAKPAQSAACSVTTKASIPLPEPVKPEPAELGPAELEPAKPEPAKLDNGPPLPEPPFPALRSTISSEAASLMLEEGSCAIVDDSDPLFDISLVASDEIPPFDATKSNLTGGDIFPRNLGAENIQVIVSSIERTGSFKRQPSLRRRSEDECVPNAREIEVESTLQQKARHKLPSAMKSSHSSGSRRRSGAANARSVSFASELLVYKALSEDVYDRSPNTETSDLMKKPGYNQYLREELNYWKSLMKVHPDSIKNTFYYH